MKFAAQTKLTFGLAILLLSSLCLLFGQRGLRDPSALARLNVVFPAAGGAPTYLVDESFEGVGAPGGWSTATIVDWDESTIYIHGSESCKVTGNTIVISSATSTNYGDLNTNEFYCRLRFNTIPIGHRQVVVLQDAGAVRGYMYVGGPGVPGKINIYHGSGNSGWSGGAMVSNTWYHVWVRYVKGTGADGFASAAFSTDGVRPVTGTNYVSTSAGTSTTTVDEFKLQSDTTNSFYFDRVLVDDVSIGDNP